MRNMVPFGIVTCCIYGHIPKIQGILAISLACFAGHLSQNLDVVLENGMEFRENTQQSSTINPSFFCDNGILHGFWRLFLMILASLLSKFWIPLDDCHPWYSWDLHGEIQRDVNRGFSRNRYCDSLVCAIFTYIYHYLPV